MRTTIVGTKFRGPDAIASLGRLPKGAPLLLRREPENPYDPNAVAVLSGSVHLGYIPRDHNSDLARVLNDEPDSLSAVMTLEAIVYRGEIKAAPKILISDKE